MTQATILILSYLMVFGPAFALFAFGLSQMASTRLTVRPLPLRASRT